MINNLQKIKDIIYSYKMLRFVLKQIDPLTHPKWYYTNNKMRLIILDILHGTNYLRGCSDKR